MVDVVFGYGPKYKRITYGEKPQFSLAEIVFGIVLFPLLGVYYLIRNGFTLVGDAVTWFASVATFGVAFLTIYSILDKSETWFGRITSFIDGTLLGVILYVNHGAEYNFAPFIFRDALEFIENVGAGEITLTQFTAFIIVVCLLLIDLKLVHNILQYGVPFIRKRRSFRAIEEVTF